MITRYVPVLCADMLFNWIYIKIIRSILYNYKNFGLCFVEYIYLDIIYFLYIYCIGVCFNSIDRQIMYGVSF